MARQAALQQLEREFGFAPPADDGLDSVDCLIANTRNNPIEELDMRFPMRCDQYELRPEPLVEVDAWLEPYRRLWADSLDALERHLDVMPDASEDKEEP